MKHLLQVKEVAKLLGVKPSTLYSWLHKGHGPPVVKLPSGAVRFRNQTVEEWVERLERGSRHPNTYGRHTRKELSMERQMGNGRV